MADDLEVGMTSNSMRALHKSKTRFINPFGGRAKALELSGLFLFDPTVEMKLGGNPLRALYVEMEKESLYKCLERSARLNIPWSERLANELIELLPLSIQDDIRAMLGGDDSVVQRMGIVGLWTFYFYALEASRTKPLHAHEQLTIDIERACVEATLLCNQGHFADAAMHLSGDPLMRNFLWPAALEAIAAAPDFQGLIAARVAVALEARLSILACWDVQLQVAAGEVEKSNFAFLLPSPHPRGKNSVSLLFQWLLEKAGVSTVRALSEDVRLVSSSIDLGTLGAWSRGTNLPKWSYLKPMSEALFGADETDEMQRMYWAATYFNFIGYYAEVLAERAKKLSGTSAAAALAPWPAMPFGHCSLESWFHSRYRYWLEFHCHKCEVVGEATTLDSVRDGARHGAKAGQ
jgi:hypothetical protein